MITLLVVVILVAVFAFLQTRKEGLLSWDDDDTDMNPNTDTDSVVLLKETPTDYRPSSATNKDMILPLVDKHARSDSMFRPYGQAVTPYTAAQDSYFVTAGANRYAEEPTAGIASQRNVLPGGEGHDADYMIARMNVHAGAKSKKAIDGAVRATANRFRRVFQNELDYNEKRVWWSSEADDDDMDSFSYY